MKTQDKLVIRATNLGKRYRLGARTEPYHTLRDAISRIPDVPRRLIQAAFRRGETSSKPQHIWALRDLNLDVRRGEVLGIIGRNGSGKTTLLKVLSRITEPTTGRVELRGRVGSLLEVGSGFHPELSGRENILLNGAILGMKRVELKQKFDEIVAFSEVEKFLDTPVKRYSSGMYVRLAFAVAAHLEPEILLIDEVLAVGDVAFQRRCLGKMGEIARGGRTVVFVSHNLAAIESFCTRAVVIEEGQMIFDGDVQGALSTYLENQESRLSHGLDSETRRSGSGKLAFSSVGLETSDGGPLTAARSGQDVVLVLGYTNKGGGTHRHVDVGFSLHAANGQDLTVLYSSYTGKQYSVENREGEFRCRLGRLPLTPGRYRVGGRIVVGGEESDWPADGLGLIDVEAGDFYGTGSTGVRSSTPILLDGEWI